MRIRSFVILITASAFISCGNQSRPEPELLNGVVTEVRMTSQIVLESEAGDDAAVGAIIGGLLTGGWGGAAVGAVIGAEDADHRFVVSLEACKYLVRVPDRELSLEFTFLYEGVDLKECSLVRRGDVVSFYRLNEERYQLGRSNMNCVGCTVATIIPVIPDASP